MTTSKASKTLARIENDIEKSREEGNWIKVIELAEQLQRVKPGATTESLCNFLTGEAKLELYLQDNPPIKKNVAKAKNQLTDSKDLLLSAASELGKKAGVALDSHLLLGKLFYVLEDCEAALDHFDEADLQSLTEKTLPGRSIRIVAESYAIKGLCLEKVPLALSSKFKAAERDEQMIDCFKKAADLGLLYLQMHDKQQQQQQQQLSVVGSGTGSHSPQPAVPPFDMGLILETALQRAPVLCIQNGKLPEAVDCYRSMISAVEASGTHSLRVVLTRQLAEVLQRGVPGPLYKPISDISSTKKKPTASPWKPKKYNGLNLFIPKNEYEEIILLLLISEAMAVREAVLSQSPEFKDARKKALSNATLIYDLLAVTLVKWGQTPLLQESLERAMKFSYEEAHVWFQFGLSLDANGNYIHAYSVLKQVARMLPNKVLPCLLLARICYQHLNRISDGIEWSNEALSRETAEPQSLLSRCHLFIGIGAYCFAQSSHLKIDKETHNLKASEAFLKAFQLDPSDHLAAYYMGLFAANQAQISEAITRVKVALKLHSEHAPSLHLMILLLTAQKQLHEAYVLLECALQDFPDCLNLLFVKAHLELYTVGSEAALLTAKHMLSLWKVLYEEQTTQESTQENRSVLQLYTSEMSDKDSNSMHTHSVAASKVEQALSEVASTISSAVPKPGLQKAWMLQLHIWVLLSEIYLSQNQPDSANLCLQEATTIFPLSHHLVFARGRVHEYKSEFHEAKQYYQNAVAINPAHIKSLQHLGLMYHYLGQQRLAEKTLRDAAKLDPHAPQTWYNLGKVLEVLGEVESATDCMVTALQVEKHCPLLPYSTIPLAFD